VRQLIYILTIFATITSCNNVGQNKELSKLDSVTVNQNSLTNNPTDDSEIVEINCDSIYKDKGISIQLISLDTNKVNEPENKFVFIVIKQKNGQSSEIFRDTIESTVQEVKFADFNNDNIKDILIQNISDVRSNWTYNLFIVDKNLGFIRKIKGFEEIKNPNYLPKYDLIDNMVMSGRNWTSFYKIVGDNIKDYEIVIYDNQTNDGSYEREYKRAVKNILIKEKNSH
jgi:hypothetical protein